MKDTSGKKRAAKKRIGGWALAGLGALVTGILTAWGIYFLGPRDEAPADSEPQVRAEFRRYYGDYPTGRSPFAQGQTVLTTLWELVVTNTGSVTDTVLSYSVLTPRSDGAVSYTGLDQGLVDTDLRPFNLPLVVDPGHAKKLYVKVGVLVAPQAEELLAEQFPVGPADSIEGMLKVLYTHGVDLFGLEVEQVGEGSFSFHNAAEAPGVVISLTTAMGDKVQANGTWYPSVADVLR